MSTLLNSHPILCVLGLLLIGGIIGALYIWRALGGRLLP